jgi:hypothetical protein
MIIIIVCYKLTIIPEQQNATSFPAHPAFSALQLVFLFAGGSFVQKNTPKGCLKKMHFLQIKVFSRNQPQPATDIGVLA